MWNTDVNYCSRMRPSLSGRLQSTSPWWLMEREESSHVLWELQLLFTTCRQQWSSNTCGRENNILCSPGCRQSGRRLFRGSRFSNSSWLKFASGCRLPNFSMMHIYVFKWSSKSSRTLKSDILSSFYTGALQVIVAVCMGASHIAVSFTSMYSIKRNQEKMSVEVLIVSHVDIQPQNCSANTEIKLSSVCPLFCWRL